MMTSSDQIEKKGIWIVHISAELIDRDDLSKDAKLLYITLKRFTNNKTKEAFPSLLKLEKCLGCKRKSIQKYLKELIDKGCIHKQRIRDEKGIYKNNIYTLIEIEAEKIAQIDDSSKGHKLHMEKTANLSIGHFSHRGKNRLITVSQFLNENIISAANELFQANQQVSDLAKVINKYRKLLNHDKLVEIILILIAKKKKFDSLSELASYLQACANKNGSSKITDTLPDLSSEVPAWL